MNDEIEEVDPIIGLLFGFAWEVWEEAITKDNGLNASKVRELAETYRGHLLEVGFSFPVEGEQK